MTMYKMIHVFKLSVSADQADEWATNLFDHIVECDGVIDPDMEAVLARGEIEISFILDEGSTDDAVKRGISIMQASLVALGEHTMVDWDKALDGSQVSATRVLANA